MIYQLELVLAVKIKIDSIFLYFIIFNCISFSVFIIISKSYFIKLVFFNIISLNYFLYTYLLLITLVLYFLKID
jgi:hypothetical protein